MFAAYNYVVENWMWIGAIVVAILTSQFWFPTVVKFFTETKIGMAIAAAVVIVGGGYMYKRKYDDEIFQRGRASGLRERIPSSTPKAPVKQQEWWKVKKRR